MANTEGNVIQDMQRFYPKISLLPYIPQIYFVEGLFSRDVCFFGEPFRLNMGIFQNQIFGDV